MQLSGVDQAQCVLEVRYALQDNWCVADIGITTGSRIHCQRKVQLCYCFQYLAQMYTNI